MKKILSLHLTSAIFFFFFLFFFFLFSSFYLSDSSIVTFQRKHLTQNICQTHFGGSVPPYYRKGSRETELGNAIKRL